tara:strand:+ start:137 stop:331 length:195 start_codon:yes stop_codon:yes gene_type:complete
MLDFQYGILMGLLGCTITFIGFFIAFLVINFNHNKKQKVKTRPSNPMYDLMKDMPGSKIGDDCQ